jgi:hypothetical protein
VTAARRRRPFPFATPAAFVALLGTASVGVSMPARPVENAPPMPEPATTASPRDPVTRNGTCEGCHSEIAAEWGTSGHKNAFADRDFRASLAREPLPFCRGCHAPEADPNQDPPADRAALGVGCVTCHSPHNGPGVLAVPHTTPPTGVNGHRANDALVSNADFASEKACARCHEFGFPDSIRREKPLLMQSTITEGANSGIGGTCNDCHMPKVEGPGGTPHRSHRFSVDETMLKGALDVATTRTGEHVTVTLTSRGVGHAFPTGDLFRRLVLTLKIGEKTRKIPLARAWEDRTSANGSLRVLAADTRLQAAPVTFTEESPRPVEWQVTYERAASRTDAHGRIPVALFGSTVLARGVR